MLSHNTSIGWVLGFTCVRNFGIFSDILKNLFFKMLDCKYFRDLLQNRTLTRLSSTPTLYYNHGTSSTVNLLLSDIKVPPPLPPSIPMMMSSKGFKPRRLFQAIINTKPKSLKSAPGNV